MDDSKRILNEIKKALKNSNPMGFKEQYLSQYDSLALKTFGKLSTFSSVEDVESYLKLNFFEEYNEYEVDCFSLAQSIHKLKESIIKKNFSENQENLREVKIGSVYKHYKGKTYKVHSIVRHSETLERMVCYECLYENELGKMWVRPLPMFVSDVDIDGQKFERFTLIS